MDTIGRGYLDLKMIHLDNEMSNTFTVSVIESKLAANINEMWAYQVTSRTAESNTGSMFPHLLEFLRECRRVVICINANVQNS